MTDQDSFDRRVKEQEWKDNLSQTSSSTTSTRAKAAAKKARLLAQREALKRKQELDERELKLRQEREWMMIDTELQVQEAELAVYEEYEHKRDRSIPDKVREWLEKHNVTPPCSTDPPQLAPYTPILQLQDTVIQTNKPEPESHMPRALEPIEKNTLELDPFRLEPTEPVVRKKTTIEPQLHSLHGDKQKLTYDKEKQEMVVKTRIPEPEADESVVKKNTTKSDLFTFDPVGPAVKRKTTIEPQPHVSSGDQQKLTRDKETQKASESEPIMRQLKTTTQIFQPAQLQHSDASLQRHSPMMENTEMKREREQHSTPQQQKSMVNFQPDRVHTPQVYLYTEQPVHQVREHPQMQTHQSLPPVSTGQQRQIDHHPPPVTVNQPGSQQLQPSEQQPVNDLTTLTHLLIKQQIRASLPEQKIMTFNGDPLKYTTFIKSFEFGVEDKTTDDRDKLNYLCQYTTGEAKALVSSCLHYVNSQEGYAKAKQLLAKRYGNSHKVAQAVLKKAQDWSDVKEQPDSLNEFSLFLTESLNMMDNIEALNELNHSSSLQLFVRKLPYRLKNLWRNKAYEIEEEGTRTVKFKDLVSFVNRQAQIVSNPVFGTITTSTADANHNRNNSTNKNSSTKSTSGAKRKAFATTTKQVKTTNKTCLYCGSNSKHALIECRNFEKQTSKTKTEFCFKNSLCFGCLQTGHNKASCPHIDLAKCDTCGKGHPTILHDEDRKPWRKNMPEKSTDTKCEGKKGEQTKVSTGCVGLNGAQSTNPLMAIIPVAIKNQCSDECVQTYAFLDSGCGAVFIDPEICDALKIGTRQRKLLISTLNSEEIVDTEVVLDNLQVGSVDCESFIDLPQTYVKDGIPVTLKDMPTQDDLFEWAHLSEIQLPKFPSARNAIPKVSIIIGMNVPEATLPLKTVTGEPGEPYAILTPLGWVVYGISGKCQNSSEVMAHFCRVDHEIQTSGENLENMFRAYVNHDFNEKLSDERKMSVEDKRFLKIMEDGTELKNGHYQAPLPFKDDEVMMPDNRTQAVMFAQHLKRRLSKNEDLHEQYTDFMEKLETEGYAEKVPLDELDRNDGRVWYIPHHAVQHPHKSSVRVVFNCPVRFEGASLNEQLLQGPDMTNRLYGVLLRWRKERVAIMADVESMFYQVKVHPEDCDMLRYLWWPNGDTTQEITDYRMKVHVFGATSSPSVANYALRKCAVDNQDKYDPEVVKSVHNDFYVDDFVKSLKDEEEGVKLAEGTKKLLAEGGFNLTKWVSNSRKVIGSISVNERAQKVQDINLCCEDLPTERTLGILWNVQHDQIGFTVKEVDPKPTRRNMLSVMSKIYDPIGPTDPYVMEAKKILQGLCKDKMGWDEPVPPDQNVRWQRWLQDLPKLEEVKLERCYKPEDFGKVVHIQLHHFADASQEGYGTVSYLRYENEDQQTHCAFVTAKARVAPLRTHTIVKMELMAATLAVKQDAVLMKELDMDIDKSVFWTDSQTVLKYIHNERARYPVFVANRIAIIRDGSEVQQWKYVPTKMNPADHASRGLRAEELTTKSDWLNGPVFLSQPEEEWPHTKENLTDIENGENTNTELSTEVYAARATEVKEATDRLIHYYSDWVKLKRAVAWWLRFKNVLLKTEEEDRGKGQGSLTTEELEDAENAVLRFVQRQSFPQEYQVLKTNAKQSLKKGSALANLDPIMSHGLMRVGGRLRHAIIPEQAKHQTILPRDHHVSILIIRHAHKMLKHQGREHVLAELRQKYWVIRAGVAIKSVVRTCVICRKIQATAGTQKMADLPANRLRADEPPFTRTGMDYFGPFQIKQGRTSRKRYGVIFTCLASRAVHLEVATSLDSSSCINALRRFISRRGPVKLIYSDNGTNLVGANKELLQAFQELDEDVIQKFAADHGMSWKFNPPAASHQGGIWERQIRTVRKILNAIMTEQHLKTCPGEEELHTFLCEVEAVINSRPLTRVSSDPADLNVITPNDLLLLNSNVTPPPGSFSDRDAYAKRRWRQIQYLADIFWKRWSREYLPMLQRRQKWLQPTRNIQIGDIVLIVDNAAPRSSWLMGRVEQVNIGNQGLVRSATIKTKTSVLTRPVIKLCLLLDQESE